MQRELRIGLVVAVALAGCGFESHDPSDAVWRSSAFATEGAAWDSFETTLESEGPIAVEGLGARVSREGGSTVLTLEAERTGHWLEVELIVGGDVLAPDFADAPAVLQLHAQTGSDDYSESSASWAARASLRVVEDGSRRAFELDADMTDGSSLHARFSGDVSELPAPYVPDPYAQPRPIAASWQSFTGSMGTHSSIRLGAQTAIVEQWSGTTTIEINTSELGYWVMARVTLPADVSDPALPDGTVLGSAQGVDLMGCTGPAPYDYDFDAHTSDVEVEVGTNDEGERVLRVTGRFDDYLGGGSVQGDVVVRML